jgi:hypothetical protein
MADPIRDDLGGDTSVDRIEEVLHKDEMGASSFGPVASAVALDSDPPPRMP